MIDAPSFSSGRAFWTVNRVPATLVLTMLRSSSSVTSSLPAFGSSPSIRTMRLVDIDSSQTTGRITLATMSSTGETNSEIPSVRCSASRLGTSSPNTSER